MGLARSLAEYCKSIVRQKDLKRAGAGARIPGYKKWKAQKGGSAEEYCREVMDGKIFDPVLGAFLRFGYSYDCVVADYILDYDSEQLKNLK